MSKFSRLAHVSASERFRLRIKKQSNGCWLWQGYKSPGGYGQIKVKGKNIRSHRYSWELYYGPIPDGLLVCHKCDVPSCVNPKHLFLGTHKDNMKDRDKKNRGSIQTGEKNNASKFTEDQVKQVRHLCRNGMSQADAARKFGMSYMTVSKIIRRIYWSHIP